MNKVIEQYSDVPVDFPRIGIQGAIGGVQPKCLLVQYEGDGKYYRQGCTPPEIVDRWLFCEDLAQQLQAQCVVTKLGKRAHMPEVDILHQYVVRLQKTNWGATEEMHWVIRRVASIINWPAPDAAKLSHQRKDDE